MRKGDIVITVPVANKIIPQVICAESFNKGFVLYASSVKPTRNPSILASKTPINSLLRKTLLVSKKIEKQIMDNRKIM
jgi:hypothetical protein